jgi:hypothetical protein
MHSEVLDCRASLAMTAFFRIKSAEVGNLWVFIYQQITVVSLQVMAWGGSQLLGL